MTYQTFVGDFEGTCARYLLIVRQLFVFVWNEVAVEVEVKVRLWDLVAHDNSVGYSLHDGQGDFKINYLRSTYARCKTCCT